MECMSNDPCLLILGEDITDPYGGAFKVTRGLSSEFPDRVLTTPISEAAITGVAAGRAMAGQATIVEIMFGDFTSLAMDQILNHASKLPWVYNNQVQMPLIIRTPMGGGRGYGATHSQSIEKHFCGMPGLTVLAINQYSDPGNLLKEAIASRELVLFIENKILYPKFIETPAENKACPDITLLAYGGMVELCYQAAEILYSQEEIIVNVVAIEQLWPLDEQKVLDAARNSPGVLVVEEGAQGYGFGEQCARVLVNMPCRVEFLAAASHPIPNSRAFESIALPNLDKLVLQAIKLFNET